MVVIGVCALKGGVGKTTACVNLGVLAAQGGEPTLLWDLDAQGSSTYELVRAVARPLKPRRLVKRKSALAEAVLSTAIGGLDLVPAGLGMRRLDGLLRAGAHGEEVLRKALRPLEKTYRWAILDCPSGLSRLVEAVIDASDLVLVPVLPTPLSVRAYEQMVAFMERSGRRRTPIVPFFSLVEDRSRVQRELMAIFRAREPATCQSLIPRRSEVESAAARRKPIVLARPAAASTQAFRRLWEEIRGLPES